MSQLYYISGPAADTKEKLQRWCVNRPDVAGVLQIEEEGKRYFLDVKTGQRYLINAGEKEKKTYKIGEEKVSVAAYEWASDRLTEGPEQLEVKWLVIDEIGQLELRKEGLHLLLVNMALGPLPGVNVVLVIAEDAVEKVLKRYGIKDRAKPFEFPE